MYRPAAFDMTATSDLHAFISAAGPAHVVTVNNGEIMSSFVPLLLEAEATAGAPAGRLVGHFARLNPQWRNVSPDVEALAVFTGPDAYISPSAYPTKRDTGKVVPTWNYTAVHARGRLIVHDDPAWVLALVTRLTERHEAVRPAPWAVSDAPASYVDAMVQAIVGIELLVTGLEGKRKLSQNRNEADVDGVVGALSAGTDLERAVAAEMQRPR